MKININAVVTVRVTVLGALVCARNGQPLSEVWEITMPLWELMQLFGPHIHMGMTKMLFVNNEIDIAE